MQGSGFIPQEFPTAQAGGTPIGQPLIGTQSSPQGDILPYQRPGAISTQSIPGSIKPGMHSGGGGGAIPTNMGPTGGQNMPGQGQFSQGAPLGQGGFMHSMQGGMGPMNPQGNMMQQQPNMMGMPVNPNMPHNMGNMMPMYPNRMQQQGGAGRMHGGPGGPGGAGGFVTSPNSGGMGRQQPHGDMRDLREIRGMFRNAMNDDGNF